MSAIDDFSPADSAMTIGKLRAWSEVHSKTFGDGTGNTVAGSALVSLPGKMDSIESGLAAKADLVDGKVPLEQLPEGLGSGGSSDCAVESVNGKTGEVVLHLDDFEDIGTALDGKADSSALAGYATTTALSDGLAAKADASALAGYATTTAMNNALAGKQNRFAYSTSATDSGMTWTDGKAIMMKTVAVGPLPNATVKSIAHGIANLDTLVRIEATATTAARTEFLVLPHAGALVDGGYNVEVQATNANIVITASSDLSRFAVASVTLFYTVS